MVFMHGPCMYSLSNSPKLYENLLILPKLREGDVFTPVCHYVHGGFLPPGESVFGGLPPGVESGSRQTSLSPGVSPTPPRDTIN